jgi:hypothetical protein
MRRHGQGRVGPPHARQVREMGVVGREVEFAAVRSRCDAPTVKVGIVELGLSRFMICSRSALRFTLFAQGFFDDAVLCMGIRSFDAVARL